MQSQSRHTVISWLILSALVLCLGLVTQVRAQDVPFIGIVNQNQTDVRAGAADRYYRVGELDKDTRVQVEEVIAGWNKIVPPEGFCSYISKAFVDAKGDGSSGVVNTDRSKVYAADVNGPAGSYRVQAILNSGDTVKIVAEEGSHYKIVAPQNAYVYLPPGAVRHATAAEMAPAGVEEDETGAGVEPEPVVEPEPEPVVEVKLTEPEPIVITPIEVAPVLVEPEPVVVAPVEPVTEPEPAVVEPTVEPEPVATADHTSDTALDQMLGQTDAGKPEPTPLKPMSYDELEAYVDSLKDTPIEDRPIDELIAQYEALDANSGLSQTQAYKVKSRLAKLRHDKEIAEGLAAIAAAREPLAVKKAQDNGEVTYDAVGRLLASSVYDGTTLPRMYRLADPATGSALAYIRPDGDVSTTAYLGKLVGVKGTPSYDPALKLKVITVELIDTLEPVSN